MMKELLYFLIGVAAASAFCLLTVRKLLHAALALATTLISIAGIYLVLQFDFLAAVQLIVYAGGVTMLIIFGVMLTARSEGPASTGFRSRKIAFTMGLALLGTLGYVVLRITAPPSQSLIGEQAPITSIGVRMFTVYAAPFELSGLLLLLSLVTALLILTGFNQSKS